MLLTWIIDLLAELRLSPKVVLKRRHHISHLEAKVYDFYKHHPAAFFGMIVCNLAHLSSVMESILPCECWAFSRNSQAYIIESLTKVINFVFAFVPGTIGVYEGGTEVILRTLGFPVAAGVALLVRKAAIVCWTTVGLLVLTWRTVPNAIRRLQDRSPQYKDLWIVSFFKYRSQTSPPGRQYSWHGRQYY